MKNANANKRVVHLLSGDIWGGKENQVLTQLVALRELGWDIRVVFFNSADCSARYAEAGIVSVIIDETQVGTMKFFQKVVSAVKELNPDILVAHGYKEVVAALFVSRRLGCPFIVVFHGASEPHGGFAGLRMAIYHRFHRMIAKRYAAQIVTVSEALAHELKFNDLPNRVVIRNIVDAKRIVNERKATTLFDKVRPALVIVGRLVRVKAIERALFALSELIQNKENGIQPHLYVLGEGPERANLERLASQLKIIDFVHFLGFRYDAVDLISQADLLLITSKHEGIPTVLLEALACGTPILSNDLPGVAEVLAFFPTYPMRLIDAEAVSEFAQGIMASLKHGRPVASDHFQTLCENFAPEYAARQYDLLYRQVLAANS